MRIPSKICQITQIARYLSRRASYIFIIFEIFYSVQWERYAFMTSLWQTRSLKFHQLFFCSSSRRAITDRTNATGQTGNFPIQRRAYLIKFHIGFAEMCKRNDIFNVHLISSIKKLIDL